MRQKWDIGTWLGAFSSGLIIIAGFLPWMELSGASFAGMTPYFERITGFETFVGKLIIVLAVALFALILWKGKDRPFLPTLVGLFIAGLVWYWYGTIEAWQHLNALERGEGNAAPIATIGIGFYLVGAGTGILLISGIVGYLKDTITRRAMSTQTR